PQTTAFGQPATPISHLTDSLGDGFNLSLAAHGHIQAAITGLRASYGPIFFGLEAQNDPYNAYKSSRPTVSPLYVSTDPNSYGHPILASDGIHILGTD